MCNSSRWLAFGLMLIGASLATADGPPPGLAKIERRIVKEPIYQGRPGYLLLVFGPQANHKVWLVRDGQTLYVDRHASGDLSLSECRVAGETDSYGETLFKVGDLTLGGDRYADLRLVVNSAKRSVGSALAGMPMFKEFLAAKPDGDLFTVSVEVPFQKPYPDLRDRSAVNGTRHYGGEYDDMGILQFADRPEEASIIHFGGPWTFAPDGQQRLVRGRNEDFALKLGTRGYGPGTFACICYDNLIPASAKPHVQIEYPAKQGEKPLAQRYVLEDRC